MSRSDDSVLVTGANGFVGRVLCATLAAKGYRVRRAVRKPSTPSVSDEFITGDIESGSVDWAPAVAGAHVVIHLAARTHVLQESGEHALARYRRINVESTRALAEAAARAALRRFVYMSSIKVNGESTPEQPYTETDAPAPRDAYGISKWEGEQALIDIGRRTGMETVVLRPPLVYGPHVKGNLLALLRVLKRRMPLPLASIRNRRSLIYVDNLVDAVLRAMHSPHAAGKTYLVSDGEDVSTPALIRKIAGGLDVRPVLFPCPVALLNAAGHLLGKSGEVSRLTGSLQVDSAKIRRELGWQPPYTLDAGLRKMAMWYRERSREAWD